MSKDAQCIVRVGKNRIKINNNTEMVNKGYPTGTYRTSSKFVVGVPCTNISVNGTQPPVCQSHIAELSCLDTVLQDIRQKPGINTGKIYGNKTGNLSKYITDYTNQEHDICKGLSKLHISSNDKVANVDVDKVANIEAKMEDIINIQNEKFKVIRDKRVLNGYCVQHVDTGALYELLPSLHVGEQIKIS